MNRISLNGQWSLHSENGESWETAVPGTVLNTLLENKRIPDPFDGMNEEIACHAMDQVYVFSRDFAMTEETMSTAHLDLVFDGIDTLADIRLNGQLLASVDNMHRTWRFDIRKAAVTGNNHLELTFHPAVAFVKQAAFKNPDVTYKGGSDLLWTGALRKAHYMFGWDWGPRLPDAGIWRDVSIEAYTCRLDDVRIRQEHEKGKVTLSVTADTAAETLLVEVLAPNGQTMKKTGEGNTAVSLEIPDPELWWPNGLGNQPIYTVKVTALNDGRTEDEKDFRIGLRTMTVSTEKDQWGSEFAFCCNGVKFFAMGADYIPEDNLLTRMNAQKTRGLLEDCQLANFNCIRVWGGGIYPSDDFFETCDEMGLVVWLDLMYACNVYKLTDAFRENIIAETRDNLKRVRHHACLGLICGNNEMESAWNGWGDVVCLSDELRAQYLEQFESVLKDVCAEMAPDSFYWPSSPSSEGHFDDPDDLNRGDVHDWSVWHGRRPFSDFTRRYPRFCSEFGFESLPCRDTLETFIHREEDMNPFSEVMEAHQKCTSGNGTMLHYLSQTLRYPYSMDKLIHSTQYLQAEAMRAGVEHWRRNRGRCMGAIYWQLNDCWPVASWASIDSLGRWKALQYAARRFFAPVLVSLQKTEDGYLVNVSNEQREEFKGHVLCHVRDAGGKILKTEEFPVNCTPLSAIAVGSIHADSFDQLPVVQCILLNEAGEKVSENEALNVLQKHFPFVTPNIRTECEGEIIRISSDAFCCGVELQAGETRFSDNWFTLYPGEERVIRADRKDNLGSLRVLCLSTPD